jgi:GNAT superfamily N-acetyltransferase
MIRPARTGDVPAILELIKELATYERAPEQAVATEDDLRSALFGPEPAAFVHVAEHHGTIAGFALWFRNFSTWLGKHGIYLEDLYVRPELRGHGYGRALLAELARIAVERGYGRLEWWVLDWNEPAIGFYRSLDAVAMDEWTVYRVSGPALRALAGPRSTPAADGRLPDGSPDRPGDRLRDGSPDRPGAPEGPPAG